VRVPLVQDIVHQRKQSLGFRRVPPFSFVLRDAFNKPTDTPVCIRNVPISVCEFGSFVLKICHVAFLYYEATHEK